MALVVLPSETEMARLKSFSPREALRFPELHSVSLLFMYAFLQVNIFLVRRIVFSFHGSASVLACRGMCYQLGATAWVPAYTSSFRAVLPAGRLCASSLIPSNSCGLGTVNFILTGFLHLCQTSRYYKIHFASYSKSVSLVVSLGTRRTEIKCR